MKIKPDILVAPFDREEAVSIAIAGSYLRIPVAHLGAGIKPTIMLMELLDMQ